jgi:hypothetical protein
MSPPSDRSARVPKLVGADVELGNFLAGEGAGPRSGGLAARLLLSAIDGVRAGAGRTVAGEPRAAHNPRDWGRTYLPGNGGLFYIDSDHLEAATCECLDAFSHVAQFHAMLRLARDAQRRARAALPDGVTLEVLANASDGHGRVVRLAPRRTDGARGVRQPARAEAAPSGVSRLLSGVADRDRRTWHGCT